VRSMHENLKLYQLDELARKVDEAFYQLFIEYPEEERWGVRATEGWY